MRRNQKGSGIIEAVFGLWLVVTSCMIATLLIFDSGTGIIFKTKLVLVTAQAAQYAAAHQSDSDVQGETKAFVQNLMPNVGLSPNSLTVQVTQSTVDGVEGEQVTISNQLPLIGKGVFPDHVLLADTEFASFCVVGSQ